MLNIFFGDMNDAIYNTNVYFNNTYKNKWITSEFAKEIIKDVDKSSVISENVIESSVLGAITQWAFNYYYNIYRKKQDKDYFLSASRQGCSGGLR